MVSRRSFLALSLGSLLSRSPFAQHEEPALSEAEVEKLRDLAAEPPVRLLAFVTFLDDRARGILALTEGKRKPGRELDLHDLYEQFTSIADDLSDNLDDYGRRHRDLRKVLPKVLSASQRWATALKTPEDDTRYSVAKQLALTSLADVQESVAKLIDEQKAWFLAHPPDKDPERQGIER